MTEEQIAMDWIEKYAQVWRQYRTRSIIYLFEKEKERYVEVLR